MFSFEQVIIRRIGGVDADFPEAKSARTILNFEFLILLSGKRNNLVNLSTCQLVNYGL